MAKLHIFLARSGQHVLDAALLNGVEMPHDCRAGRCGACLTRVKTGITLGGETRQAGMVHACQAMVFSDLALEVEPLPPVSRVSGTLAKLSELAEDIVEVTIEGQRRHRQAQRQGVGLSLSLAGSSAVPHSGGRRRAASVGQPKSQFGSRLAEGL